MFCDILFFLWVPSCRHCFNGSWRTGTHVVVCSLSFRKYNTPVSHSDKCCWVLVAIRLPHFASCVYFLKRSVTDAVATVAGAKHLSEMKMKKQDCDSADGEYGQTSNAPWQIHRLFVSSPMSVGCCDVISLQWKPDSVCSVSKILREKTVLLCKNSKIKLWIVAPISCDPRAKESVIRCSLSRLPWERMDSGQDLPRLPQRCLAVAKTLEAQL